MEHYKVLLVEDDDIVAIDTRRRLESLGHEVAAVVSDGPAALEIVRDTSPDVVLMDIGLPGDMDGIDAAAKLRALWDAPIVYLTALEDEETLARAKATEPYGYLLKPSTNREIQITMELAVHRLAAERERAWLQYEVRRLEGMVPICMRCKKVRNDAGYWRDVEAYLAERSGLLFSHGLCPDCLPSLYPPADHPYLYRDEGAEDAHSEGP